MQVTVIARAPAGTRVAEQAPRRRSAMRTRTALFSTLPILALTACMDTTQPEPEHPLAESAVALAQPSYDICPPDWPCDGLSIPVEQFTCGDACVPAPGCREGVATIEYVATRYVC